MFFKSEKNVKYVLSNTVHNSQLFRSSLLLTDSHCTALNRTMQMHHQATLKAKLSKHNPKDYLPRPSP